MIFTHNYVGDVSNSTHYRTGLLCMLLLNAKDSNCCQPDKAVPVLDLVLDLEARPSPRPRPSLAVRPSHRPRPT